MVYLVSAMTNPEKTNGSAELLLKMEKSMREAFYCWLVFVLWLMIARGLGLPSAKDDLWEWRLWFLFGIGLFLERWAIQCLKIIVAAIKEMAAQPTV